MVVPKRVVPPEVPYGTHPRPPAWPLALWIIVFALWFAGLIWMAVSYPAG